MFVQGVDIKCTMTALPENRGNREPGNILVCANFFLGIGRATRLTEDADIAFPVSLVNLTEPSVQILVLLGSIEPDATCVDGLAFIHLELELLANGVAVAVGIGELVNLDLVLGLGSIDPGEGEDGGGNELAGLA